VPHEADVDATVLLFAGGAALAGELDAVIHRVAEDVSEHGPERAPAGDRQTWGAGIGERDDAYVTFAEPPRDGTRLLRDAREAALCELARPAPRGLVEHLVTATKPGHVELVLATGELDLHPRVPVAEVRGEGLELAPREPELRAIVGGGEPPLFLQVGLDQMADVANALDAEDGGVSLERVQVARDAGGIVGPLVDDRANEAAGLDVELVEAGAVAEDSLEDRDHLALRELGALACELRGDVSHDDERLLDPAVDRDRSDVQLEASSVVVEPLRDLVDHDLDRHEVLLQRLEGDGEPASRVRSEARDPLEEAHARRGSAEPLVEDARAFVGEHPVERHGEEAFGDVVEHAPEVLVLRGDPGLARGDRVAHAREREREPSDLVVRLDVEVHRLSVLDPAGGVGQAVQRAHDHGAREEDEHHAEAERQRERRHEGPSLGALDGGVVGAEREREAHDAERFAAVVGHGPIDHEGISHVGDHGSVNEARARARSVLGANANDERTELARARGVERPHSGIKDLGVVPQRRHVVANALLVGERQRRRDPRREDLAHHACRELLGGRALRSLLIADVEVSDARDDRDHAQHRDRHLRSDGDERSSALERRGGLLHGLVNGRSHAEFTRQERDGASAR